MASYYAKPRYARKYLASVRDYVDGEQLHGVDAKVSVSLCFRRGTIMGDTRLGHTLHETDLSQPRPDRQREVEGRVRAAFPLSEMLAAGDVEIVSVDHDLVATGGLEVITRYRNLRASPERLRSIRTIGS
jgi:hypothetical protein